MLSHYELAKGIGMVLLKVSAGASLALAVIIVGLGMLFGGTTDTIMIGVLFFVAFCFCWGTVEIIHRLDALTQLRNGRDGT